MLGVNVMAITRKELALMYGVHRNTLTHWLNSIGISQRKVLFPKDLALIYAEFGNPDGK